MPRFSKICNRRGKEIFTSNGNQNERMDSAWAKKTLKKEVFENACTELQNPEELVVCSPKISFYHSLVNSTEFVENLATSFHFSPKKNRKSKSKISTEIKLTRGGYLPHALVNSHSLTKCTTGEDTNSVYSAHRIRKEWAQSSRSILELIESKIKNKPVLHDKMQYVRKVDQPRCTWTRM